MQFIERKPWIISHDKKFLAYFVHWSRYSGVDGVWENFYRLFCNCEFLYIVFYEIVVNDSLGEINLLYLTG